MKRKAQLVRAPSVNKNHHDEEEGEEDEATYVNRPGGRRSAVKRSQTVMGRGNAAGRSGKKKVQETDDEEGTGDEERNDVENSEEDERTAQIRDL